MLLRRLALAVVTALTKIGDRRAGRRGGPGSVRRPGRAGTALVPRGEFNIVIAGLAVTAGITRRPRPAGRRVRADPGHHRAAHLPAGEPLGRAAARRWSKRRPAAPTPRPKRGRNTDDADGAVSSTA